MGLARRGRPRKEGARHKCGLLIQTEDLGTIEQRLKREIAAGIRNLEQTERLQQSIDKLRMAGVSYSALTVSSVQRRVLNEGLLGQEEIDAVVAFNQSPKVRTGTDALDILLARRIIDRDQFEVALDFTACWCVCFGRPWPKGWKAERQLPDHNGGIGEGALKAMKVRYWNCIAAMDSADRTIYPMVRDVVIHDKMLGIIESVSGLDIVRQDFDGGGLVSRRGGIVPPALRQKIGRLTKGIDIIAETPRGDYTREALAMLDRLKQS